MTIRLTGQLRAIRVRVERFAPFNKQVLSLPPLPGWVTRASSCVSMRAVGLEPTPDSF